VSVLLPRAAVPPDLQNSREDDLEIDWHPFDLRGHKRGSDGEIVDSIEDGKDEVYFEQVRENVAKLREQYDAGEMLDLDELPEDVDSFDAQVASWYVRREHPGGADYELTVSRGRAP